MCTIMRNVVAVCAVILFMSANSGSAQVSGPAPTDALRSRMCAFLRTWIVEKDENKYLEFFDPRAFSNRAMLSEPCTNGLTRTLRRNPRLVRRFVRRVLREYTSVIKVQTLSEVLSTERLGWCKERFGERLLNEPKDDQFCLIDSPVLYDIAENPPDNYYFARTYPRSRIYASVIDLTFTWEGERCELIMYFLWVQRGGVFRIVHAGEGCP